MRRLALLPAVVALALPGAAAAGTVSMTGEYVEGYKGSGGWEYDVRYAAEPGEPNALSVWREPGAVVVVDDAGVAAGTGCESRSATEAVCAPPRTQPGWIRVTAHLGDRDDRLAATTAVAATGDDGDDRLESPGGGLEGGPGDDVLVTPAGSGTGGPGDDRVVAGTARYDDRSEPVVVDLAAGTAVLGDEHDALVGVRDVVAGRGNDRVTGSAEANRIETGAGDDVVLGGAGDDRLDGQLGFDQLDGGDGDDVLWAGGYQDTAPNVVLGGAGGDDLHGSWGPDRLVGGTGRDHLAGDRGHDETDARDGEADFVGCRLSATNPHARVVADRLDLVRHCGPLERDGVPSPTFRGADYDDLTSDGTVAELWIACSQDVEGGCAGRAAVRLPGRRAPSWRGFRIRPGGIRAWFEVALPPAATRRLHRCGRVEVVAVVRTSDAAGRPVVLRSRDVLTESRDGYTRPPDCGTAPAGGR